MRTWRLAVLGVASALPFAANGVPAHATGVVIDSGGGPGHGWEAFVFETTGSTQVTIASWGEDIVHPHMTGIYIYHDTALGPNQLEHGYTQASWAPGGQTYADVHPAEDVRIYRDDSPAPSSSGTHGRTVSLTLAAGIYRTLVWSSGEEASWRWELRGDSTLVHARLSRTSGSHSFIYSSKDIGNGVNVGAYAQGLPAVPGQGAPGARASGATRLSVDISDVFIGIYYVNYPLPPLAADALAVEGPNGIQVCATACSYPSMQGTAEQVASAGRYTFHHSGAAAMGNAALILGGADARLPD